MIKKLLQKKKAAEKKLQSLGRRYAESERKRKQTPAYKKAQQRAKYEGG